jgi:hypothetical protein
MLSVVFFILLKNQIGVTGVTIEIAGERRGGGKALI